MFKNYFGFEKYRDVISQHRYRIAKTQLHTSSHTLEIERERYPKPKIEISKRLCSVCNLIDDEVHFLVKCELCEFERKTYFDKMTK